MGRGRWRHLSSGTRVEDEGQEGRVLPPGVPSGVGGEFRTPGSVLHSSHTSTLSRVGGEC